MTTKKAKPAKKKAEKKSTAKKRTSKTGVYDDASLETKPKKITEIFPDLIPVEELDKHEVESDRISKKTGNKKLSKKEIKDLEDKLNICENQRIAYLGTPAEKHYEEKANEFRKLLGRD